MNVRTIKLAPLPRFEYPLLSIALVDGQASPLRIDPSPGRLEFSLATDGLNRVLLDRWLIRHGVDAVSPGHDTGRPATIATALPLPTIVVVADPRVEDLARLHATLAGAPLRTADRPDSLGETVRGLPAGRSLTAVLLSDRLDEALCQSINAANQARRAAGLAPVRYGFLAALNRPHLAWLLVKTWVLLLSPPARTVTFSDWDFSGQQGMARTRDAASGRTSLYSLEAPWVDERVNVLSVRAHGASFDLSLGETVLCSHFSPPVPGNRITRGPSCFHDGVCFRMAPGRKGPTIRILAQDATPLVWCLDSCATLPFTGNAFGNMAFAFSLIAGAAVGVMGPFLDIVTSGGLTRLYEAVIATGGSLSEAAAAACGFEPARGFDRFLLIGSPDLRLLPSSRVEPAQEGGRGRYLLWGHGQQIWRLAARAHGGSAPAIVGDDGDDIWASAHADRVEDEGGPSLLVTLPAPADMDGWLLVGAGGDSFQVLEREAARMADSLAMLQLYPFVDPDDELLARCRGWTEILRRAAGESSRVRARAETALALAKLRLSLEDLHQSLAERFLAEVAERDVSLDRIPGAGFDLEPTARAATACPGCGSALYVTRGRWSANHAYVRRWVQCANCAGIALAREDGRLVVRALTARLINGQLEIMVRLRNRSGRAIQATLAGQARRGPPESGWGPSVVKLEPRASRTLRFSVSGLSASPGVISYRLLALCDGDAQLYALRYPVESNIPIASGGASTSVGGAL
jgi:hypothetical protein